jgi:hypothetical protein
MGKRQVYHGPTRSLRPKNEGVITVVVDNNHAHRRRLKKSLGRSFKIVRRDGPEPGTQIDDRPCSECGVLMRDHMQPDYSCPDSSEVIPSGNGAGFGTQTQVPPISSLSENRMALVDSGLLVTTTSATSATSSMGQE